MISVKPLEGSLQGTLDKNTQNLESVNGEMPDIARRGFCQRPHPMETRAALPTGWPGGSLSHGRGAQTQRSPASPTSDQKTEGNAGVDCQLPVQDSSPHFSETQFLKSEPLSFSLSFDSSYESTAGWRHLGAGWGSHKSSLNGDKKLLCPACLAPLLPVALNMGMTTGAPAVTLDHA